MRGDRGAVVGPDARCQPRERSPTLRVHTPDLDDPVEAVGLSLDDLVAAKLPPTVAVEIARGQVLKVSDAAGRGVAEDLNPFVEDLNPFVEDLNPFVEDPDPFVEDPDPFVEDP